MDIKKLLELAESECLAEWPDADFFERAMGSKTEAEYSAALRPEVVAELVKDAMAFRLMVDKDLSVEICSECSEITVRHQHADVLAEEKYLHNKRAATRMAITRAAGELK